MRLAVHLDGADTLARRLRATRLDEHAIAAAAAVPIAVRARVVVPKDTGRLMRSIHVEAWSADTVAVVASAPYASQVAYGGPSNPRPVPFMEIAVTTGGSAVTAAAEREVTAELHAGGLL